MGTRVGRPRLMKILYEKGEERQTGMQQEEGKGGVVGRKVIVW